MTTVQIATASGLIRSILKAQLSLCNAVYPQTHPDYQRISDNISVALGALDDLVQFALLSVEDDETASDSHEERANGTEIVAP